MAASGSTMAWSGAAVRRDWRTRTAGAVRRRVDDLLGPEGFRGLEGRAQFLEVFVDFGAFRLRVVGSVNFRADQEAGAIDEIGHLSDTHSDQTGTVPQQPLATVRRLVKDLSLAHTVCAAHVGTPGCWSARRGTCGPSRTACRPENPLGCKPVAARAGCILTAPMCRYV